MAITHSDRARQLGQTDKETLSLKQKHREVQKRNRKHVILNEDSVNLPIRINQKRDASTLQCTSKSEHGVAARGL